MPEENEAEITQDGGGATGGLGDVLAPGVEARQEADVQAQADADAVAAASTMVRFGLTGHKDDVIEVPQAAIEKIQSRMDFTNSTINNLERKLDAAEARANAAEANTSASEDVEVEEEEEDLPAVAVPDAGLTARIAALEQGNVTKEENQAVEVMREQFRQKVNDTSAPEDVQAMDHDTLTDLAREQAIALFGVDGVLPPGILMDPTKALASMRAAIDVARSTATNPESASSTTARGTAPTSRQARSTVGVVGSDPPASRFAAPAETNIDRARRKGFA